MVLSADVRREKLEAIRKSADHHGSQKLFYQGAPKEFKVHRIDLDYLIYNQQNGRIEAEILTWEQMNSVPTDEYNTNLHEKITTFLWESNVGRNKATLQDLKAKSQLQPGIVSLDGVIIDGNRRAMLLRRLEEQTKQKQYLEAIILPQAYAENAADIVRLETQYQMGEDAKVDYGPLQKYLHARRLHDKHGIDPEEIDELMSESKGNAKKLLAIMALMDDYLEHIGCPKLYLMLKDADGGTKEGMFVDLYADIKRLTNGSAKVPWAYDQDLDPMFLQAIQFDYIRFGDFADAKKVYREISHQRKGRNFFANKEIWEAFRDKHQSEIDPITKDMGALEEFIREQPDAYDNKIDAARARDEVWSAKVDSHMKSNFNQASYKLNLATEELKPGDYLRRAKDLLERIDLKGDALMSSPENKDLALTINGIMWEIKKRFDRQRTS